MSVHIGLHVCYMYLKVTTPAYAKKGMPKEATNSLSDRSEYNILSSSSLAYSFPTFSGIVLLLSIGCFMSFL